MKSKFNKTFYKNQLIKIYGDNPPTRKMMMVVELSMDKNDKYTWEEFLSIFDFLVA